METIQNALQAQAGAAQAAADELRRIEQQAQATYQQLRREMEQAEKAAVLSAVQTARQRTDEAYHDLLTSQNPLGLGARRQAGATQYAQQAAYNTYTADAAWAETQKRETVQKIKQAYRYALGRWTQQHAVSGAKDKAAQQTLAKVYTAQRMKLLRQAAKRGMGPTDV